ncbi:MAG: hypothetical protein ACPIOQ_67945, partial [Promethearchaeia archaeon]
SGSGAGRVRELIGASPQHVRSRHQVRGEIAASRPNSLSSCRHTCTGPACTAGEGAKPVPDA